MKKTKKVYILKNVNTNEVEYVGCSQNIKRRLFQHTRVKPIYSKGEGKFYGRTDLAIIVLKEFDDKTEAVRYESKIKKQFGFVANEWESKSKEIKIYDYKTKKLVAIYPSFSIACKTLNVGEGNMYKVIVGQRNHTGGYYAEYV